MQIEMTGRQDREGPWKIGIAGFPGAGKTLFASTSPEPLFVFFQENPRLKSIADRHIPHVKIVNETTPNNGIISVQDRLNSLVMNLNLKDHKYQTLVIDTGDELYQAMKAARRMKNGGEFGIADWGWIADAYREVVTGLIDLDMDVLVLYHLKSSQDGEDGSIVRELMLQGASQDEAPGWFDVIGALDTFETTNDAGDAVTKRVFLTHSSRLYPWVKDHSGALPARFTLTDNFVGDMTQLLALLHEGDNLADKEVIDQVVEVPTVEHDPLTPIPTPEDLQAKKTEVVSENQDIGVDVPVVEEEKEEIVQPEPIPTESGSQQGNNEASEVIPDNPPEAVTPEPDTEQDGESPVTDEEAVATVIQELGAEEVKVCAVCGTEVKDQDLLDLTQIRFRMDLCRPHFTDKITAQREAQAS